MHDADGNNKLDGLELVASLQHWHGGQTTQGGGADLCVSVGNAVVGDGRLILSACFSGRGC